MNPMDGFWVRVVVAPLSRGAGVGGAGEGTGVRAQGRRVSSGYGFRAPSAS
jgi:hypothetical protein